METPKKRIKLAGEAASGNNDGQRTNTEKSDDSIAEGEGDDSKVIRTWETKTLCPSGETIVFSLVKHVYSGEFRWETTLKFPSGIWNPECKASDCHLFSNQKEEICPDPDLLQILQTILKDPGKWCNEMKKQFKRELTEEPKVGHWWVSQFFQKSQDNAFTNLGYDSPEAVIEELSSPDNAYIQIRHYVPVPFAGTTCAVFHFEPDWEDEHGVALITDGADCFASCYCSDLI